MKKLILATAVTAAVVVYFVVDKDQPVEDNAGMQNPTEQTDSMVDSSNASAAQVADNDKSIDAIDLVGNKRFLTLTSEDKTKAASSFATNSNVKTLNLNSCGIDDEFAIALALALKRNNGITRVFLEGNAISGVGITALFEALGKNSSIEELRLHKQSKTMNTSEEHLLPDILLPNTTLTKLGVDLRTTMARVKIDKKLNLNRNAQLKLRAEAKGETFHPKEVF